MCVAATARLNSEQTPVLSLLREGPNERTLPNLVSGVARKAKSGITSPGQPSRRARPYPTSGATFRPACAVDSAEAKGENPSAFLHRMSNRGGGHRRGTHGVLNASSYPGSVDLRPTGGAKAHTLVAQRLLNCRSVVCRDALKGGF